MISDIKQNQSEICLIKNQEYIDESKYKKINGGDKSTEIALTISMLHSSANKTLKDLQQNNLEMRTAIKALSNLYDGKLEDI